MGSAVKCEMRNNCFPIGLTAAMMAFIASNFLIALFLPVSNKVSR